MLHITFCVIAPAAYIGVMKYSISEGWYALNINVSVLTLSDLISPLKADEFMNLRFYLYYSLFSIIKKLDVWVLDASSYWYTLNLSNVIHVFKISHTLRFFILSSRPETFSSSSSSFSSSNSA